MSRTKKRKLFECIEYLSVEAPLNKVDYLEDKQSKYTRKAFFSLFYSSAILLTKPYHSHGLPCKEKSASNSFSVSYPDALVFRQWISLY